MKWKNNDTNEKVIYQYTKENHTGTRVEMHCTLYCILSQRDILDYLYRYDTSCQVFFRLKPIKTGLNLMSGKNRILPAETQPWFAVLELWLSPYSEF